MAHTLLTLAAATVLSLSTNVAAASSPAADILAPRAPVAVPDVPSHHDMPLTNKRRHHEKMAKLAKKGLSPRGLLSGFGGGTLYYDVNGGGTCGPANGWTHFAETGGYSMCEPWTGPKTIAQRGSNKIVALPTNMMTGNLEKYCGKEIVVHWKGKTISGLVAWDGCVACNSFNGLDFSSSVFGELVGENNCGLGKISDMTWELTDNQIWDLNGNPTGNSGSGNGGGGNNKPEKEEEEGKPKPKPTTSSTPPPPPPSSTSEWKEPSSSKEPEPKPTSTWTPPAPTSSKQEEQKPVEKPTPSSSSKESSSSSSSRHASSSSIASSSSSEAPAPSREPLAVEPSSESQRQPLSLSRERGSSSSSSSRPPASVFDGSSTGNVKLAVSSTASSQSSAETPETPAVHNANGPASKPILPASTWQKGACPARKRRAKRAHV